MSDLTVVLDGITVQHAGELLFDSAVTSQRRKDCKETYLRCVEDFAFALVYGSRFSVSGSLPSVGGEYPGTLLVTEFNERASEIKAARGIRPENLIFNEEIRGRLRLDMEALTNALHRQRSFWHHWIIREAESYLGNHETLFVPSKKSEIYVYEKSPTYITDRELQSLIPDSFLEELVGVIRSHCPDTQRMAQTALCEFVSRNALTLMAIYWWYSVVAAEPLRKGGMRLPHVTRSLVRSVQKADLQRIYFADTITLLGRHALSDAASSAMNREDIVNRLHGLPDMEPYPKIRQLLIELFQGLTDETPAEKWKKAATKIRRDIRRIALSGHDLSDQIDIQVELKPTGLGGRISVPSSSLSTIRNVLLRQKTAFRKLFHISELDSGENYFKKVDRIFPELRLGD
jgi:hypothetical protein